MSHLPFTRRGRHLIVVVTTVLFLLVAPAPMAGASSRHVVHAAGPLRDLQPADAQPTDGARAGVLSWTHRGTTTVLLLVSGLDRAAAGTHLGAHVHSGTCVAGDGAAAGPHYNSTGGGVISPSTEVWLDFSIGRNGHGWAMATVPFTIPSGGASAVVIHAMATDHGSGAAGPRWACLPVAF